VTLSDDLQQAIEQLLQLPRLTPEAVGKTLRLALAPAGGTPYFATHQATLPVGETRPDGVASVELRAPLQPQGAQDGLLIVAVTGAALTLREAVAQRGQPAQLLPSMPEDPERTLALCYPLRGGVLRLIFDDREQTLRRFVLDRTEQR